MDYYLQDEKQLEKSKKEAIIKQLRDEVDEMKVRYLFKDKSKTLDSKQKTNSDEINKMNILSNDTDELIDEVVNLQNNNNNYNNLNQKNEIFNRNYRLTSHK